ncbi:hypothetical protein Tco_0849000 [Tanacetum coccineum]
MDDASIESQSMQDQNGVDDRGYEGTSKDNEDQLEMAKYKFQDQENSEDIFSFGSALEDFICVVIVLDRNIVSNSDDEIKDQHGINNIEM